MVAVAVAVAGWTLMRHPGPGFGSVLVVVVGGGKPW